MYLYKIRNDVFIWKIIYILCSLLLYIPQSLCNKLGTPNGLYIFRCSMVQVISFIFRISNQFIQKCTVSIDDIMKHQGAIYIWLK